MAFTQTPETALQAVHKVITMTINRRTFFGAAAGGVAATAATATAQAATLDAAQFGVRANAPGDQSAALQRALEQAAQRRQTLLLAAGQYRVAGVTVPPGASLAGARGATRLILGASGPLLSVRNAPDVSLTDLVFDGGGQRGETLIDVVGARQFRLTDCQIARAAGVALKLTQVQGSITGNTISDTGDIAMHSLDARGLVVSGNAILCAGNGGINIWRSDKGADGSIVSDNRIERIAARAGGSGQNGNAVNIYSAGNVVVRGNRIRDAAFSAVRGNAASGLQIVGNGCTGIGEVALYVEFDFEGAVVSGNTVDDAAIGVAVTNFKEGGRLAVVQGNVLRNITRRRPAGTDPNDGWGIGIGVEADTAVTGNVIEGAAMAGIAVGAGDYLRDVTVTGNVVRNAPAGIMVSVTPGAGAAVISGNRVSGASRGAIVGMAWDKVVSVDLVRDAAQFPKVTMSGNSIR
ncbi:MAG: TIGR03808 family TAT-translocated repetitive protein [Pseudolabrys sp.]